jgi:hypothetical protein
MTKKSKKINSNNFWIKNIRSINFKRNIYFLVAVIISIFLIETSFQVKAVSVPNTLDTKGENIDNSIANSIAVTENISAAKYENYEEIAQNSKYRLFYNSKSGSIIIENKKTKYLWKSVIDYPADYNLGNLNTYWENYISSLLVINYTDITKNEGKELKAFSSVDANIVRTVEIDNGVSIDYDFFRIGISITVEISLWEDGITIRIPADKIKENKEFGIMNIEIAPFFGAETVNPDGYMFYPDGSGAIMRYKSIEERPKFISAYKGFVFSPEKVDISEYIRMEKEQEYNAMLPIYGIKNGNNAFLAIVTKGSAETAIYVAPYGFEINLNRAYFELHYRHFYTVNLSNINLHGIDAAKRLTGKKADKEPILKDREIRYIFLDSESADYSGMANAYREYLIKNNELKKTVSDENGIPMLISLFMGTIEKRMLFDKYISMTTFQEAKSIVEKLKSRGIDDLQLNLVGWTKGGYGAFPDGWPPENRLGGIKEMNKLIEYTTANNVKLYLQTNLIDAIGSRSNYSKRKDIVMQGNGLAATDLNKERFIINPISFTKRIQEILGKIPGNSSTGINLGKIGRMLYHHYNKGSIYSRIETLETWKNVLALAERYNIPVGVDGGNLYVLSHVDHLFNIPLKSSGYHIEDETIPFFQMIVHGTIPYTSEPGNLVYDLDIQKLQWIEFGCMPFFELTYEDTIELKYTNYNKLFNSQYEKWLDTVTDIYKEFNEKLKDTWDAKMIEHKKINDDLVKVTYDNGIAVFINYGKNEVYYEGHFIKAQDYIVVHGGEVSQ